MNVSVFSLLMSVLWSSLIILVAHLLRRKAFFLRRVGAPVLVVFYLLSVGRMVLPVEFPFSREVPLRSWFSTAVQAVCIEEHQLGDFGWTWAQAACLCWAAVGIILLLWFSLRYWRAVRRMTQSLARDPLAEEILQSIRKESKRSLKVQVFRTPDETLPRVKDEAGNEYVDNRVNLRIISQGKTLVERSLTKASFASVVDQRFLQHAIFEGLVYDTVTSRGVVFAASVSYPQSDLYVPIRLTFTAGGHVSMETEDLLE